MSTERKIITGAIRRLAETSPAIRSLLQDAENRGGKPRAAGVGGGAGSEEGSNTSKETSICCDGSTGDPNPGVDEQEAGTDQSGLDPTDPASLDLDGACLTGVTECTSGDAISFCGDDFIPPDGWTDPDDPPLEAGYDPAYYHRDNDNFGIYYAQTGCGVLEKKYQASPNQTLNSCSFIRYTGGYSEVANEITLDDSGSVVSNTSLISRYSCAGANSAEALNTCGLPPPREEAWPSDGAVNLAIKNGTIVGSKYDPDQDGSYSAPVSEIQLCDGANQISLKPSGSVPGGFKSIDAINGGDGYLYNKQGEQIARISGDEYSDPLV